mmetsp:Transcript_23645/g.55126  ORF Transcript_23645/g.55126 Transcript_23645/m.55126 type:complete len:267 (-) Transcript_23645:24-824(-)
MSWKAAFITFILSHHLQSCYAAEPYVEVESSLRQNVGVGEVHYDATPTSYTQNSVCVKRFCINPVFPAFEYFGESLLSQHSTLNWTCIAGKDVSVLSSFSTFCSRVISEYTFSLPSPPQQAAAMTDLIAMQSKQAIQMYAAHLSGMGYDLWDYTKPWEQNDCIQSIWRMSCYTYFPRCNEVEEGRYLRPCRSSCQNYIKSCNVECCDEGLQCVFRERRQREDGSSFIEEGYVDHIGPSPFCTGFGCKGASLAACFYFTMLLSLHWI